MKIVIEKILPNNIVEFKSDYGHAVGKWRDDFEVQLEEYYVEIEVETCIKYSEIFVENASTFKLKKVDNSILITGVLEEYDRDGYAVICLGDNIIQLETEYCDKFRELIGQYISFIVDVISIYDEHI